MNKTDPYAELLHKCANGDQHAFSRIYAESNGQLMSVSQRMLQNHRKSEEALQDSYLKIWNNAGRFDGSKAQAMTWMTTIVRNRCLDIIRAKKIRPQEVDIKFEGLEFQDESADPSYTADLNVMGKSVLKCLQKLERPRRQAIFMSYYYGMTHDEIAAELDVPLGTLKGWIRRGVIKTREQLMAYEKNNTNDWT